MSSTPLLSDRSGAAEVKICPQCFSIHIGGCARSLQYIAPSQPVSRIDSEYRDAPCKTAESFRIEQPHKYAQYLGG